YRFAGTDVIAGDDFFVATLLLRVEEISLDGERRPPWANAPAPPLDGWRRGPVVINAYAAYNAASISSAEAGPLRRSRRYRRYRSRNRRYRGRSSLLFSRQER